MDLLGPVLNIAKTIYVLCGQASSNKRQCLRLEDRIKKLLLWAKTLGAHQNMSAALQEMADQLLATLENAKCWVIKYSNSSWWMKKLQAKRIREEFEFINDRLGDICDYIKMQVSTENLELSKQLYECFNKTIMKQQNAKDMEEDLEELKTHFQDVVMTKFLGPGMKMMNLMACAGTSVNNPPDTRLSDLNDKLLDINLTSQAGTSVNITPDKSLSDLSDKLQDINNAYRSSCWELSEIQGTDLTHGELLLERETHRLYRGEYRYRPVAIKVFKCQSGESDELVRKTFQDEKETMKKLECLNIVRLYGISIDHSGAETSYSLVMELCSKGTLREQLQREPDLTWERRVLMALDVTRAVYRLLQTEEKDLQPGTLSSSRFLVDDTYCVMLSVSSVSSIESAIKKIIHGDGKENSGELEYRAPETREENKTNNKSSALYSLGVLIFEIATGKRPFHGLEVMEENLAQMQEQWWGNLEDELPSSCPQTFKDLIRRLLQKNPEDRPSAGVVVDLLLSYLNKCELEKIYAEASE